MAKRESEQYSNFVNDIVSADIANSNNSKIVTRFPPEPNGYLHLGHVKSIILNLNIAKIHKGKCNLRFDDTNPEKEQSEFVKSILEDIHWLGFFEVPKIFYTSDYFDKLYDYAKKLIQKGKAYVDDLDSYHIKKYRGTLTEPGENSPFRNRSIDKNLDLFKKMKQGSFKDGEKVLRAKIDMSHPNLSMRDPILYRIKKITHHRTRNKWCIYPMYDFSHCISDSIEKVTHSLCTLEFENNRILYNWILEAVDAKFNPKQVEFARLNLSFTLLSKRKLKELIDKGYVSGWDDPRMPTISGLRRRGYTPGSIRSFCEIIGVAKRDSTVDISVLEHVLRKELNYSAPRVMAVLKPLKVLITNYPETSVEYLDAINNPEDLSAGTRKLPFSREIYIEQDDFMENPPKKFFRLGIGREVRLRYAFFITCTKVIKDPNTGNIIEIHCSYDPETKGGNAPDGRKVKATLHWVSASHSINAEVRLYDRLLKKANPSEYLKNNSVEDIFNTESLTVLNNCKLESNLSNVKTGFFCQFERLGYFCLDNKYFNCGNLVFNRTVALRDKWTKLKKQ